MLLSAAKIDPVDVRLLRHKNQRAIKGRSPYEMWRDDREQFELYQSTQKLRNRPYPKGKLWAAFIGTPTDERWIQFLDRMRSGSCERNY